jgi:hypothetical protein
MSERADVRFAEFQGKVVGGIVVIILIVAALGIGTGILRERAAHAAVGEWLELVATRQSEAAHALLSDRLRSAVTAEELAARITAEPGLQGELGLRGGDYDQSDGRGVLVGSLQGPAGSADVRFDLRIEEADSDSRLAIDGLVIGGRPILPSSE